MGVKSLECGGEVKLCWGLFRGSRVSILLFRCICKADKVVGEIFILRSDPRLGDRWRFNALPGRPVIQAGYCEVLGLTAKAIKYV